MMRAHSRLVVAAALAAGWPRSSPVRSDSQQPAPPPDQPIFRSSTRLIVQTVTVKDKDGQPIEGLTAKDFVVTEDGEPQDIAFVEFQRLGHRAGAACRRPTPRRPRPRPPRRRAGGRRRHAAAVSPPPAAGDTEYRDRRLLILYFDLSAMPLGGSAARLSPAAPKYIDVADDAVRPDGDHDASRAAPSASSRTSPTTARVLADVIDVLIYGEDKDGDGVRDEPGSVVGLRPGRRRVQHLQHRSPAGGAADGGDDAAAAARAEVARLLRAAACG